jgi:hypothetical protein
VVGLLDARDEAIERSLASAGAGTSREPHLEGRRELTERVRRNARESKSAPILRRLPAAPATQW